MQGAATAATAVGPRTALTAPPPLRPRVGTQLEGLPAPPSRWVSLFDSDADGTSLATLLRRTTGLPALLLVVSTESACFGAFLSEATLRVTRVRASARAGGARPPSPRHVPQRPMRDRGAALFCTALHGGPTRWFRAPEGLLVHCSSEALRIGLFAGVEDSAADALAALVLCDGLSGTTCRHDESGAPALAAWGGEAGAFVSNFSAHTVSVFSWHPWLLGVREPRLVRRLARRARSVTQWRVARRAQLVAVARALRDHATAGIPLQTSPWLRRGAVEARAGGVDPSSEAETAFQAAVTAPGVPEPTWPQVLRPRGEGRAAQGTPWLPPSRAQHAAERGLAGEAAESGGAQGGEAGGGGDRVEEDDRIDTDDESEEEEERPGVHDPRFAADRAILELGLPFTSASAAMMMRDRV